ncbi:MAG: cupin domain-containing protein [Planctomycetes bacterium]|nr:cupin domain-containing protein [Planctomycetota bacterium]
MMAPASGALAPSAPATVEKVELLRGSQSWDGAELPDYPAGKPELVAMRYVFPAGCKLSPHKHPVMNYGVVTQGELTIIGPGGIEKVVRAGEPVAEMVGTPHHGENRGAVPVVLYMFYVSQKGQPLSVPVPEGNGAAK